MSSLHLLNSKPSLSHKKATAAYIKPEVHYRVHKVQSSDLTLSQMNIIYLYITFKLIPSTILNLELINGVFALGFPTKILHSFFTSFGSRSVRILTETPNIVRGSVIFLRSSDNGRFIPHLFSSLLTNIQTLVAAEVLSYGHTCHTTNKISNFPVIPLFGLLNYHFVSEDCKP
jgi:hypothetical protein